MTSNERAGLVARLRGVFNPSMKECRAAADELERLGRVVEEMEAAKAAEVGARFIDEQQHFHCKHNVVNQGGPIAATPDAGE